MSQHDYDIANGSGAAVRSDLNSVLDAIHDDNAGASAPSTVVANMKYVNTTDNVRYRRDAANTAWLPEGTAATTRLDTKVANYTVVLSDFSKFLEIDSSAGDLTVDLPAAATAIDGWHCWIKNSGAALNQVTIDANGSEQINNALTLVLEDGEGGILYCAGDEWFLIRGSEPSMVLIGSGSPAATASVDFTSLEAGYDYILAIDGIYPSTDNVSLQLRFRDSLGAWRTTSGDYIWANDSGTAQNNDSLTGSAIPTSPVTEGSSNNANRRSSLWARLFDPRGTAHRTGIIGQTQKVDTNGDAGISQFGGNSAWGNEVTGLRIYYSSGNITAGEIRMYRVRRA